MSRPPSRVVFVGNIPYNKTEEQIIEIFSTVGKVLNFRLVYDKETGRPKGFGFAEFPDPDTAASAVRNLNNMEIDNRKLRVDFSNESAGGDDEDRDGGYKRGGGAGGGGDYDVANGHGRTNNGGMQGAGSGSSLLPPLPAGRDLPPGVTCTDAISQTLRTLEPGQLLDFIRAMKDMAVNDTERCIELLNQAPQMGFATFQALLLMGLVSPDNITGVLDPHSTLPRPQLFVPGQQAPGPAGMAPPNTYAAYPPAGGSSANPVGGYAQPPPVAAPAPAAPDTEQLMQAVLQLTDDQINALPPNEREQIRAIRVQLGRR